MPAPTLPDLEALSLDDLKKLVVQLLVRVVALEEENAPARGECPPEGLAQETETGAGLYQATGRYAEAEPLFQRVLSIFEKALGPEHPNIATIANSFALPGLTHETSLFLFSDRNPL